MGVKTTASDASRLSSSSSSPRYKNVKEYIASVKEERPAPDFCEETQSLPMKLGTMLAYVGLVTAGLTSGLYLMFRTFILGNVDPLQEKKKAGYSSLLKGFGSFYQRTMYAVVNDCWSRPISSAPGVWIDVVHRKFEHNVDLDPQTLETSTRCLNLGSYNYLGFASSADGDSEIRMREHNQKVVSEVSKSMSQYGIAMGSSAQDVGQTELHTKLEKAVARFVGKEDALVFGMGYATNSTTIPSIAGPGTLIISDSLNHASLVVGCRGSGATCDVFRHNDLLALENILVKRIRQGRDPKSKVRVPWAKIIIIVEGIYSMEGEILRLPEIIAIKKKYKCYLYVDEAHSIGSLGPRARGVCDYWGINPADVDVLMGTFTKSFSSVGGYIAASADVIGALRVRSIGMVYATAMPIPCVQQILSATSIISGEDGTGEGSYRIQRLRENSIYFRSRLKEEGFLVAGDYDSPVIPVMIYSPWKFCKLSRRLMERGIAIVVVGYPATPLLLGRARFCMSSAHTIEQLERAVSEVSRIGKSMSIDYMNANYNPIRFIKSLI